LPRGVALGAVLVAWAVVTYGNRSLGITNPVLLPTPGDVAAVAMEGLRDGSLLRHGVISFLRVIAGFGLAAGAALALGLLAGLCTSLRLALEPVLEFVRPIPPLAFLPMFLVWFGLGEASKVAFIGYTTFFPMFVAIAASVTQASRFIRSWQYQT
jgi:ABC-type nitrate/sulfonate/bicarbonate transport system permease component